VEGGRSRLIGALDEQELTARAAVGARATHDRDELASRRRIAKLRRDLAAAEHEGQHAARHGRRHAREGAYAGVAANSPASAVDQSVVHDQLVADARTGRPEIERIIVEPDAQLDRPAVSLGRRRARRDRREHADRRHRGHTRELSGHGVLLEAKSGGLAQT